MTTLQKRLWRTQERGWQLDDHIRVSERGYIVTPAINGCVLLNRFHQDDAGLKAMLHRIVAMLTRMAMKFDGVAESSTEYGSTASMLRQSNRCC